jgi:hypothetical protein
LCRALKRAEMVSERPGREGEMYLLPGGADPRSR